MNRRDDTLTPRGCGVADTTERSFAQYRPITAQMLVLALRDSEDPQGGQYLNDEHLDGVCIDGWYDLEKAARLLNERLVLPGTLA